MTIVIHNSNVCNAHNIMIIIAICNAMLYIHQTCGNSCQNTYKCTVAGTSYGITVWRGSALSDCDTQEISLLHRRFTDAHKTCNNGAIVARGISNIAGNGTDSEWYTSQLTVTVTPELIGKNVECAYDDVINVTTIGTLNISAPGKTINDET